MLVTLPDIAPAVTPAWVDPAKLRELRLEEDLCRRADVGWIEPDKY